MKPSLIIELFWYVDFINIHHSKWNFMLKVSFFLLCLFLPLKRFYLLARKESKLTIWCEHFFLLVVRAFPSFRIKTNGWAKETFNEIFVWPSNKRRWNRTTLTSKKKKTMNAHSNRFENAMIKLYGQTWKKKQRNFLRIVVALNQKIVFALEFFSKQEKRSLNMFAMVTRQRNIICI